MENYLLSDGDIVQAFEFQKDIMLETRTNNSILNDEIINIRVERQADLQGAFSSGGGYCPDGIPVETAILGLLGAFGVAFGVLYRALTITTGGRKKRDISVGNEPQSLLHEIANHIADLYWWGMFL